MAALPEHITGLITSTVESYNLILLEIIRRGQTNSTVLEIIVDSEEGVHLDTLADISREIGAFLDEADDVLKGRYRLEVSTPGLDRPLEHDWQFRKNLGRLVSVTWVDQEQKKMSGLFRLLEFHPDSLNLEPVKRNKGKTKGVKKDQTQEPVTLPLEKIERVVVEPEI